LALWYWVKMAITLTADPTDSESNSFVTVDDADDYFAKRLYVDDWPDDEEEKKKALIWASGLISRSYRWKGRRAKSQQKLAFPRTGLYTLDLYEVDDATYPDIIVTATCELALFLSSGDPSSDSPFDVGLTEIKVSSIGLKFDKNAVSGGSGMDANGIPENISSLFSDFYFSAVGDGDGQIPMVRA